MTIKDFRFRVIRKKALCIERGLQQEHTFTLPLTQEQFEDYQYLKDQVHATLDAMGIPQSEAPYWREDPPVDAAQVAALKAAIGAPDEADFIAYYAHSYHHRHYKLVTVGGEKLRYMGFSNGLLIKFAPELAAEVVKLQPISSHPDGQKSISDDDLCATCGHCGYNPGELSGCSQGWPGLEDADGYVQECAAFLQSDDAA